MKYPLPTQHLHKYIYSCDTLKVVSKYSIYKKTLHEVQEKKVNDHIYKYCRYKPPAGCPPAPTPPTVEEGRDIVN